MEHLPSPGNSLEAETQPPFPLVSTPSPVDMAAVCYVFLYDTLLCMAPFNIRDPRQDRTEMGYALAKH